MLHAVASLLRLLGISRLFVWCLEIVAPPKSSLGFDQIRLAYYNFVGVASINARRTYAVANTSANFQVINIFGFAASTSALGILIEGRS
jgi:hypothetical protein